MKQIFEFSSFSVEFQAVTWISYFSSFWNILINDNVFHHNKDLKFISEIITHQKTQFFNA